MSKNISKWAAIWGLRLAVLSPFVMMIAGGTYRLSFVDFGPALLAFAVATLMGLLAVLLSLIGVIGGVRGNNAHGKSATLGLVVALIVVSAPLNTVRTGAGVPMIHDITTDLEDPPTFVEVPRQRASTDNSLEIDQDVLAAQKAYYTGIAPTMLAMSRPDAFSLVRDTVKELGWQVHAEKENLGYIEATAATPFFGFRDDVVIRLTQSAGNVRVDMRSASRVGLSDLGVNAGRISDFMTLVAQKAN